MTKARQLADLGNVYDDGALSNRNLIINGEFLISQRGDYTSATSLTNNTYYLDRFINRNGVAGTIQQTSNMPTGETGKSVKMLTTASGTAQFVLEQFIEPQTWMTSKTYTASCWIKSNSNKCSITLINNGNFADRVSHTGSGNWEKITLTFNIGSTLSDFRIRIGLSQGGNTSISSGDYFEFTQLQLEVGDTATPFEHRSYGDELALCQRFTLIYQPHYFQAFPVFGAGSNTTKWFPTFPVRMRVKPTLITKDVSSTIQGFNYVSGSALAFQSFTLAEGGDLASHVTVTFNNTNGGIANGVFGHWRWISTPTGSYVGFDAEL